MIKSPEMLSCRCGRILMTVVCLTLFNQGTAAGAGSFYSGYASALDRFVSNTGMVDYRALQANRSGLDSFADSLAALDSTRYNRLNEQEQIAFWINAYNALTLRAIIDNYPIEGGFLTSLLYPENSIRQINGVWDELTFQVMGQPHTLDRIEHEILRAGFSEPRIHMALACAAMGCPPLRREPYTGISLDSQLDSQTVRFLSDRDKFRIDREKGRVHLSPIFDWFGEDFVAGYAETGPVSGYSPKENAVLNFIVNFLDSGKRDFLSGGKYKIHYLDYDWSLNEKR